MDEDIEALTAKLSALHKRREEIAAVLVSAGNRVSTTRYAQSAKQSLFIMCRSLQDMLNLRVRRAAAEKERNSQLVDERVEISKAHLAKVAQDAALDRHRWKTSGIPGSE